MQTIPPAAPARLRAAVLDLSYSALRAFGIVDGIAGRLLHKPAGDPALLGLLYATLENLRKGFIDSHTVVDQAVRAAERLSLGHAKGLVNAVLRNYLRQREAIDRALAGTEVGRHQHPQWWIDLVRAAYPAAWEGVLAAGNAPPPMSLRINRRRTSVEDYLELLHRAELDARRTGPVALTLNRPVSVSLLPGFADGLVSVQDVGAQAAAALLDLAPGQRVMDACAAPGGKTGHILEQADVALTAVDNQAERARRIEANLVRLGLNAKLVIGDCAQPEAWWDGKPFDRILADVPCTGSGVVRRHPDMKWLRRPADLGTYGRIQAGLLDSLWKLLAPGGKLLYVTCSVFPSENNQRIDAFLLSHSDATRTALLDPLGELSFNDSITGQLLPTDHHDGFYFALLCKR